MPLVQRKSFSRGGWLLAAAATLAISGTGIASTAVPATADDATSSSACAAVNPMGAATPIGSEDGYTIFVTGDASLSNSELEGSLAVGGTATFSGGRFPIVHQVAGSANYNVPTIDGEANRLLVQKANPTGGTVVQVQSYRGSVADSANAKAGAKIGDQSVPAGYTFGPQFGGSGTTFFPADGDNQSSQIESQQQPWTTLEAAEESWAVPSNNVLAQFPADSGTDSIANYDEWTEVATPTSGEVEIALDGKHPSKLSLSDFANVGKFEVTNYSDTSFLVIQVSQDDVVGGKVNLPAYKHAGNSTDGEGISYVLYDFSKVAGDVELTSADRIRGAIYAPNTHIVITGYQFEGQLIAADFTNSAAGEEMHTNLFAGHFPCSDEPQADTGTFSMQKLLDGVTSGDFPEGTTFPVTATWSDDEGEQSKTFDLPADGTEVAADVELPEGTVVTLAEGDLPKAPEGYTFESKDLSAESITILADGNANIGWTVTNTYTAEPDNPTEEPSETPSETPSESVTTPGTTDTPSEKPGDDMPNTGAQGTLALVIGGLVLVAAGTGAVLVARRRQAAQG